MNEKDTVCLNSNYCTAAILATHNSHDKRFLPMLFLPSGEGRQGEGGLRMQGYFNKSLPEKPLLTVITVVFNGADYIENCINSVIRQVNANVEYIIIDAASRDKTLMFLEQYNDAVNYWVSEKDNGLYEAMNKGLSLATGDFVYFLGVDDRLAPEALEKITNQIVLSRNDGSVIYGDVYMPNKHKLYDGKFSRYKLGLRNICHQAVFYPRKVYAKEKFNLKYRIWADYEYNIRASASNPFCYFPILVAYYNDTGISSKSRDQIFLEDHLGLIRKNWGFLCFAVYWCRSMFVYLIKSLYARISKKSV